MDSVMVSEEHDDEFCKACSAILDGGVEGTLRQTFDATSFSVFSPLPRPAARHFLPGPPRSRTQHHVCHMKPDLRNE